MALPELTAEQMTLLEDIATGAWQMLQTVIAQRNPAGKFQIKTPKSVEERVMGELSLAGYIETGRLGRITVTGLGTKIWRAELDRRRKAEQDVEKDDDA